MTARTPRHCGFLVAVVVVVVVATILADGVRAGSCRAAKLCCQGRDSGCVIQKESPNAIIESPRDKPCYCDHACLKLADCCDDFKETCGVVDCAVGEWSSWTACDNGCGTGTQRRSRQVKSHDRNGGKHCPRLDQARTCRSFADCPRGVRPPIHDRSVTLLSLMPAGSNCTDRCNDDDDDDDDDRVAGKSGCIGFTVVRASRACGALSSSLTEGARICLSIASTDRLLGIGRWKLAIPTTTTTTTTPTTSGVLASCHGKWIGDPRVAIDCDDPRCDFRARTATGRERTRRAADDDDDDERTASRRRRRKRRRRAARRAR